MNLTIILILIAIAGLVIGSFLNVVIYRYPLMLERRFKADCHDYLSLAYQSPSGLFNLALPRSQCVHCQSPLTMLQNIPLISFIALRGRSACCQKKITWQYPLVEALSAFFAVIIFYRYNLSLKSIALTLFCYALITLFFIDLKKQILPDLITLSFLWLGLLLSMMPQGFISPTSAILGASLGYVLPWTVGSLYQIVRKKPGMGHGDYKMLAMLGAWMGPIAIPVLLTIATLIGLVMSLGLLFTKKISVQSRIPFGPFIAIAGWIYLLMNFKIPFLSQF